VTPLVTSTWLITARLIRGEGNCCSWRAFCVARAVVELRFRNVEGSHECERQLVCFVALHQIQEWFQILILTVATAGLAIAHERQKEARLYVR
jgi:hypothetical protein